MENIRTLRSNVLGNSSETLSAKLATGGGGRATSFEQNAVSDIDRVLSKRSFYFQKRFGKINLDAISQISIQHVQDEVDIELLQQNLEMIVFGDLESSDAVQDIDESFAKLFRLSQLTVEYLLSVQDSLAEMLDVTSKQCRSAEAKLKKARGRIRERDATISHLKQYIRNRQSALEWYKLQLPGGGPNDRTRRHGPGGTAESSAAPSPAASVRSAAPTPDLRGAMPGTTTAPIATLPPDVLAKLETIGSNEANMQQMINELRQSKDSMAEEFRLSSQKLKSEITALKEASAAAPPKIEAPAAAAAASSSAAAVEAKPQGPGGFGAALVDDASPRGDEAGWSVDIGILAKQISSLQDSVKLLLEAKGASPAPAAAPASAAPAAPAPATADTVTSPGGAPVESPAAAEPANNAEAAADVKVESSALEDKDELTSSNHDEAFLPICFEDVAGQASVVKAVDAKSLKQCALALVHADGVDVQGSFKTGSLRLDHWIESPDVEDGGNSGAQCLNDALGRKAFDVSSATAGSPQEMQTLAHQAKLALDIIVASDDGTIQTELKDAATFGAAPLCFLQFKGAYYHAYSVEAMQEYIYGSMSSTMKKDLGIAEEMGGSAELVALSSSSTLILRTACDVLKTLLAKDLTISFISTKSASVISEEQGEDLMILHSHVSSTPRQSASELEEEYEKLARLKDQLDNLDHSNASAVSELSMVQDQFDSIAETISKIP